MQKTKALTLPETSKAEPFSLSFAVFSPAGKE
jgi:hypothetical protein